LGDIEWFSMVSMGFQKRMVLNGFNGFSKKKKRVRIKS
jgi:hypothetical protein